MKFQEFLENYGCDVILKLGQLLSNLSKVYKKFNKILHEV